MTCKCKEDFELGPQDSCLICAEKHFTTAMRAMHEYGYKNKPKQRSFSIGEIGLALEHIQVEHPDIAQKMRIIRHYIQYHQDERIGGKWDEICLDIYNGITAELVKPPTPSTTQTITKFTEPLKIGKIFVFSNIKYPKEKRIIPQNNDLLVFLNKAESIDYYSDHKQKIVYHRSPKEEYGLRISGVRHIYVFGGGPVNGIPRAFIDELKKKYDWNYDIEDGKIKSMTTGYMVVRWIQHKYPDREIVLVNFGYDVKKSTYRCPWHNWKFEAEDMKDFPHLYLEDQK